MESEVKRWFDPRVPIGRIGFVTIQVIGSVIEEILRRGQLPTQAEAEIGFVMGSLALSTLLAIATVKRLRDADWSRWLTLIIIGPTLFDLSVGVGNINSLFLRKAVYPLFASYIAYILLVAVLAFTPSRSRDARFGDH
jgi:uncharacterized membrane protein YhaH (DUF805 family)